MDNKAKLVIAPNEDGYGTSAWVVMLAKEISRHSTVATVKVVVATDKRFAFHSNKYLRDPSVKLVQLDSKSNKIEIVKSGGAVDVHGTINQCILTYPQSRATYAAAIKAQKIIDDADIIIDFGVPQMVRTAHGKLTVTVFDHAWSLSLRRIVSSDSTRTLIPTSIEDALEDIRNDEALTQGVILFGEPICPLDYHGYWTRLLGKIPGVIPGSVGGPLCTLAYLDDPSYEKTRQEFAENNDHSRLQPVYEQVKKYARELLGIENDEPVLFVSGGGTPVWDDVLSNLLDDYELHPPNYNVVIHNLAEAKRRHAEPVRESVAIHGVSRVIERAKWKGCKKVTFIGTLENETHHVLFSAFNLILSRAGGGTVNNALAFRVPMVLVEESGMWQVEQIRYSCTNLGIAESISLDEFKKLGRKCVETKVGDLKDLSDQRQVMHKIPNHGELWLSHKLLALTLGKRP